MFHDDFWLRLRDGRQQMTIKAYQDYKAWWIEYQAPASGGKFDDVYNEQAFEEHINSMSLYTLMETLAMWVNDEY